MLKLSSIPNLTTSTERLFFKKIYFLCEHVILIMIKYHKMLFA